MSLSLEFITHFSKELSAFFQEPITVKSFKTVSGGSINQTYRVITNQNSYFLKLNDANSFPNMFENEAVGLQTLHGKSGIFVPKPLLIGEIGAFKYLVMDYLEKAPTTTCFWKNFGYELATLHRNTASKFGLIRNNYIGSLPQSNKSHSTWSGFFRSERLNPLAEKAAQKGLLGNTEMEAFIRLYNRIDEIFPNEPPTLLHGDLWSGNFMCTKEDNPAIFDPAVYYGHREMDIAMTKLFGGFNPEFYEYYNEAFPLAKGWESRVAICNLYPLLVHLLLFGSSYLWDIKRVLKNF